MDVFISWSGPRSNNLAEILTDWLPMVIQAVTPWMSKDIEKGARWSPEISEKLAESKIGIICLTPENLHSDWILFEAGALSKVKDTKVCTFLFELTPAVIKQPLAQFQHTILTKEDVKKLITTINDKIEHPLPEKTLNSVFDKNWPDLETKIKAIAPLSKTETKKQERSERDLLEEILELTRRQSTEMIRRDEFERMSKDYFFDRRDRMIEKIALDREQRLVFIKRMIKKYPILKEPFMEYQHLIWVKEIPPSEARLIIADKFVTSAISSEISKNLLEQFFDSLL